MVLDTPYEKSAPQTVEQYDADAVLVMYGVSNFLTDSNLLLMAR